MPDETTDPYRVAAEAWVIAHRFEPPLDDLGLRHFTRRAMEQPDLRAAVDAVRPLFEAAGREAAAQAIEALYAPKVESDTPGTRATIRSILRQAAEIARGGR